MRMWKSLFPKFIQTMLVTVVLLQVGCNQPGTSHTAQGRVAPKEVAKTPFRQDNKVKVWSPTDASNFLISRLPVGTYQPDPLEAGRWFACSQYWQLPAVGSVPNNVAYYIQGSQDKVDTLKLVLNVNDRETSEGCCKILAALAKELTKRAEIGGITAELDGALRNAKITKTSIGGEDVSVTRDDWPTGLGFELHYIIGPRP